MSSSSSFVRSAELEWDTVGDGVRRKILGYGPDLMLVHVEFHKGGIGALHHHPHRQVTFVARGSFEATVDEVTTILETGDCFFVAANLVHGVVALEDGMLIDVFTPAREDFLAAARTPARQGLA